MKPGPALATCMLLGAACAKSAAPELTSTEQRWLEGVRPVVAWALKQRLPIEITVLPQARPGDAPVALGYVDGRCELVFAMRGNPAAEATLDAVPPAILQPVIEAMAAHELGHCWRHVDGAFSSLPPGVADAPDTIESRQPTEELKAIARQMRITRREEAFSDLVGLAWTRAHHAQDFATVLAWLEHARADETERGFHDTRRWLALARDPAAFGADGSPFQQAMTLWRKGLDDDRE